MHYSMSDIIHGEYARFMHSQNNGRYQHITASAARDADNLAYLDTSDVLYTNALFNACSF